MKAIRDVCGSAGTWMLITREEEVLQALIEGGTDKEIADRFGIAVRTASNHVSSLLKKTGMKSREDLRRRFGR